MDQKLPLYNTFALRDLSNANEMFSGLVKQRVRPPEYWHMVLVDSAICCYDQNFRGYTTLDHHLGYADYLINFTLPIPHKIDGIKSFTVYFIWKTENKSDDVY